MPPTPPAPMLDLLNFEQLTWLVNETSPEVFYRQADAFDRAANDLRHVADRFRRELRHIDEASSGEAVDRAVELSERIAAENEQVLQAMMAPGYGALLRKAGDALAMAQGRIRDLQMQRGQQPGALGQQPVFPQPGAAPVPGANDPEALRARQIVHDLSTAYADVGAAMTPLQGRGPGSATPGPPQTAMGAPPGGQDTGAGGTDQVAFTRAAVGGAALTGQGHAPSDAAVLGRPASTAAPLEAGAPSGGEAMFAVTSPVPAGTGAWVPFASTAVPTVLGQARQQRTRSEKRTSGMRLHDEPVEEGQPAVLGRDSTPCEQRSVTDTGDGEHVQPGESRPNTESSDVDRSAPEADVEARSASVAVASEHPTGSIQQETTGVQHATATGMQHPAPPQPPAKPPAPNVPAEPLPPIERPAPQTPTTPPVSSSPKVAPPSTLDLGQTSSSGTSSMPFSSPPARTAPADLASTSSGLPMTGGAPSGGTAQPQSGSGQTGFPMTPMMGAGMQPQDQTPRQTNVPLGADPDSWDDGAGVQGTLGRPEPEPDDDEPDEAHSPDERVEAILRDLREKRKIR